MSRTYLFQALYLLHPWCYTFWIFGSALSGANISRCLQISMHARFLNPLGAKTFSFALSFLQLWTAVSVWALHYLTFLQLQFASCQTTPSEGSKALESSKKAKIQLSKPFGSLCMIHDVSPQTWSAWHCNLLPFQQFRFFCAHDFSQSILVSRGRYRRVRLV